jgi:dethiobiotin synthetase
MQKIFVTGIGTDVGKTIVSAVLVEALQADYWKPIQAGDLDNSDTQKVQRLVTNTKSQFHKEAYRLNTPASPHYAAELDGIEISLNNIQLPQTTNQLIIEGAGGLMVPINQKGETIIRCNKAFRCFCYFSVTSLFRKYQSYVIEFRINKK